MFIRPQGVAFLLFFYFTCSSSYCTHSNSVTRFQLQQSEKSLDATLNEVKNLADSIVCGSALQYSHFLHQCTKFTFGISLCSYPPFYDEDQMKTYAKIMHGAINFPKHFSKQAQDLISNLLHMKPTKRLGVVKGGASTVKKHPWFEGFNWEALAEGKMVAPIIPEIRGDDDLSNFEEYPEEDEEIPPYEDDKSGWDDDF